MEKKEKKKPEGKEMKFSVGTRGRTFEGRVIKKFPKRVVIELERRVFIPKYERFLKKKTKIHARIDEGISTEVGEIVRVRECRPLSKIVHFLVVDKIGGKNESD